jgi:galactan endo-1,6-beta-galactosidase
MSALTILKTKLVLATLMLAVSGSLFAQDPLADGAPRLIKVDPKADDRGVWQGWGVSLCWWGKVFGDRDDLADWLYTMRDEVLVDGFSLPALGMNIARYNAGATSFNEIDGQRMVRSKTILPFRQIHAFWLDPKKPDPASDGWDWSADANQREMLLKARDRGANRFELFSNSPPWWMCANNNPSGATRGEDENLRPDNRDEFAHYLAAIARRAKDDWGVTFTTVAAFNEPSSNYWYADGKQEGAHFSPASQIEILPLVRAALDRQGLTNMALSASDETSYDHALTAWRAYPPESKALVSQVNVHGYQGGGGDRVGLDRAVRIESGKPLWNSEHGDPDATGFDMASNFHRDMAWLRPLAWCYWQAIDGGHNGKGNSGWGLLDGDMVEGRLLRANPKAYVLAQYSRHIRHGMRILDHSDREAVVAFDQTAGRLVVAALNHRTTPSTVRVDLSAFSNRGSTAALWLTEPFGETRYTRQPDLTLTDTTLLLQLPARSVLTVQLDGVRP